MMLQSLYSRLTSHSAALLSVVGCLLSGTALAAPDPGLPTLTCGAAPYVFNTGADAAGTGKLAYGSADTRWQMAYVADSTLSGAALPAALTWQAAVVTPPGPPSRRWLPEYSDAAWISASADPDSNGGNATGHLGTLFYQTSFNLPADIQTDQFAAKLLVNADDAIRQIYVNGQPVNPAPYDLFAVFFNAGVALTLSQHWKAGDVNTIVIQTVNTITYHGLLAQASAAGPCASAAVTPVALNLSAAQTGTMNAGSTQTYTVTLTNNSPTSATTGTLTNAVPAGLTKVSETCAISGSATAACTLGSAATLPPGDKLTYTLTATVDALPAGSSQANITNLASWAAATPATTTCTATPAAASGGCAAELSNTVIVAPPGTGDIATAVPVDARWMLLMLTALVALMAAWYQRRQRRG